MRRDRLAACLLLLLVAWPVSAQDGPGITFLAGDAARAAIVDESVEPYFSLLCLHEMEVKSGIDIEGETLEEQQAFFAQHYADNVRDFTEEEQEVVTGIVSMVHDFVAEMYPRFAAYPWSFIKVTDSVEQGLPHTRGHSIVLPENLLSKFTRMDEVPPPSQPYLIVGLIDLFLHEQMHVIQRLNPELFAAFYTEHWDLIKIESFEYVTEISRLQLVNPDGVDAGWVQNVGTQDEPRFIQPNIFIDRFDDRPSEMPGDFQMLAVVVSRGEDGVWRETLDENGLPEVSRIENEQAYMAHYGESRNVYHPNESFADLFAKTVLFDLGFYPGIYLADGDDGAEWKAAIDEVLSPVRGFMREAFGAGGRVED